MKNSLMTVILASALVITQSCGPKSESKNETAAVASSIEQPGALTGPERRAKLERLRAERAEKRRLEFEERARTIPTYTDSKGYIVYNKAEVDPSFVGGDEAMAKYLKDNTTYPQEAKDKGLEGTVFVDFVVASDGRVREVVVADAVGEDVDQSLRDEAARVVSSMPRWIPGTQRKKAVDVNFSIPITFMLD